MSNASHDAGPAADHNLATAEFLDRIAEKRRVESGGNLPRQYFLEQLRRELAGSQTQPRKDERFQSSACFDAWARPRDEKAAGGS